MRAWEERALAAANNPPGTTVDVAGRKRICSLCLNPDCPIRANWGRNCEYVNIRLARANIHCPLKRF